MKIKKGIILAGGNGSRLYPLTGAANKQLLPIYDKPVIYYPLTTLMLAGIQDILIISTPKDLPVLQSLLGSGKNLGINFSYQVQQNPNGLPEAFILAEKFINHEPVAMILGDNFFHGHGLSEAVFNPAQSHQGAHIFIYSVMDPQRYGIVTLNQEKKIITIDEKPSSPNSNLAITGLYYFDGTVAERARLLKPSKRNELEIVDLISGYLSNNALSSTHLGRGYVWFDTGTPRSLLDASNYVEVIQSRQGTFIASPEEVAWFMGFVTTDKLEELIDVYPKCEYKDYLRKLIA